MFSEYLLKGKGTVAVLPTCFGKSQLLPGFLPIKADNDIMSNGLTSLHDSATVRDIYTFSVFCSVTDLFFRFTRVYEGHFVLCYKEEPS